MPAKTSKTAKTAKAKTAKAKTAPLAPGRAAPRGEEGDVDGRTQRRLRTEEKLVAALGEILASGGVEALGVNAVTERAGVEKVLLYRYFGDLDGLMATYAERSDFWPSIDELLGPKREALAGEPATVGGRILVRYARALRRRPVTLDLLAWECAHRNALTIALERVREERSVELAQALAAAGIPQRDDVLAVGALFAAAINYLAVRGRALRVFGGLAIGTDEEWERIEGVLTRTFAALLDAGR